MAARTGTDWRAHLTPAEADKVKDLEAKIAEADTHRRHLSADLNPIRGRAIKRASRGAEA